MTTCPPSAGIRRLACLAIACLLACAQGAAAQTEAEVAEYNIKAAFLYKFATYVDWPPGAFGSETSPLVFGVIGADLLAEQLAEIVRGKRIQDRVLRVRRLEMNDPIDGLHVLFIGRSMAGAAAELVDNAAGRSVLTVTETGGEHGQGIIDFLIVEDRVKFTVSLAPAERGNLRISSRLLQVAQKVQQE